MTGVSNAGFTCDHCTTIGTFGLAYTWEPRLVDGQRRDSRGIIHDPVYHEKDCPTLDPAYRIMRALA